MNKLTDFSISIAIFLVLFSALIAEHVSNNDTIDQQHNTIYQQNSQIEDLKYQIGQCRLLQVDGE